MKQLYIYTGLVFIIGMIVGVGVHGCSSPEIGHEMNSNEAVVDSLQHEIDCLRHELSVKDSIIIRQWIMIQPCEFEQYYCDTLRM